MAVRLILVTKKYIPDDMASFDQMWKSLEKDYDEVKINSIRMEDDRDVEILDQNNALVKRAFQYCSLDILAPAVDRFDVTFEKTSGSDLLYIKFTEKKSHCFVKIQLDAGDENVFSYGAGAYEFMIKPCTLTDEMINMFLQFLHTSAELRKRFFDFWIVKCMEEDCPCICFKDQDDIPTISFDMLQTFSFMVRHGEVCFNVNYNTRSESSRFALTDDEFASMRELIQEGHAKCLISDERFQETVQHLITKERTKSSARIQRWQNELDKFKKSEFLLHGGQKRLAKTSLMQLFFTSKKPKIEN